MTDDLQALADALNTLEDAGHDVDLNHDYIHTTVGEVAWEGGHWVVRYASSDGP